MTFTIDDVGDIKGKPSLTDAEKQAVADEWNANAASAPRLEWLLKMRESDSSMPRYVEDIIDAMDAPTLGRLAPETMAKHGAKKALRAKQ